MTKKIGDLTLKEIKAKCPNYKYECNICDYCNLKRICFSEVWMLLKYLDEEIEVEE